MAKKKDEHHGGAWKVAYADFVTSMMALFIVLWVLVAEEKPEVMAQVALYFKDPGYTSRNKLETMAPKQTTGVMDKSATATQKDASMQDAVTRENQGFLKAIARDFIRLLNVEHEDKEPVDVQITSDGLKMNIFNRAKKPVFKNDTTELTEWGTQVFQNLAWLVERYNFLVYLEGHTAQGLDLGPDKKYTPWELSTDRANAVRRTMEYYAMATDKTKRVSGFGDTQPLPDVSPDSEDNNRMTVSLSLTQTPKPSPSPTPSANTPTN
ncbi:MAG: flagellar motor protein MotB [Terrimicrobiaceae bacterium]